MIRVPARGFDSEKSRYLLALHSSSDILGVAVLKEGEPWIESRIETFPVGRGLSNCLITCVEEVFPSSSWSGLVGIGVAIGPGGFTGNRLTVVMARSLAQQLDCPLYGLSSFSLMAPRLVMKLNSEERIKPFWIVKYLRNRRIVAGSYLVKNQSSNDFPEVDELVVPHLLPMGSEVKPTVKAEENVADDVARLIRLCEIAYRERTQSSWTNVLPIYPTSPVGDF